MATLTTSTSRILLNGFPSDPIQHGRGLRQGDPLSPLLFILAFDPLHRLLSKATDLKLLRKLGGRVARFRISMYADDAVIFARPDHFDIRNLARILDNFGEVTGLRTNLQKTSVTPINCGDHDLEEVLSGFPVVRSNFPIKYLGLPLAIRRLRKIDIQPLVEKATSKISGWQGRHLTQAGRVCLTKSVLSSQPVYLLTVLKAPIAILDEIDRARKKFLWAGDSTLTGGKCKVNWERCSMPKENGGLGILNLERFARALRLRWLWHEWNSPNKAWLGTKTPCDDTDHLLFAACTTISISNGKRTSFWHSGWLEGRRPKDIAPNLFKICQPKNRTVVDALQRRAWIRDVRRAEGLMLLHIQEFVTLWGMLRDIQLNHNLEDRIRWKFTESGEYTAASAYRAQFLGCVKVPKAQTIWKAWAPPKCKFFAWLVTQNRVWTSDRL